jgi:hypothetical protein
MKKLLACLGAAALLLGSLPRASADEARAAEAFQRGAEAYGKNDFTNAARLFEQAYAEAPRGAAIYNAGLAWESAGDTPRATDAYALAISRGDLSAAQSSDAQARMKALMRTLGRAEITGPAGTTISIAHAENRRLPATVHLAPGTYPVRVTYSDNSSAVKLVTVSVGATTTLALERPAPPPVAPLPAPPPTAQPKTAAPPAEPAPDKDARGSTPAMRYVGFSAIGVGALLGGAAIITGVKALSARDEFNDSRFTSQEAHDRAESLRTTTNVLLVAAGVVGVTGIVLVLTSPSSSGGAQAALRVGPREVGVDVRF